MKRGLVVLDPAETPPGEFAGRLAALQRRLAAEGVFAALIYGDVYRSGDISYLTNLCIYWNEGLLLVPASGQPVFLTRLSARVHRWMKDTSTLTDLRSGTNLAGLVERALNGVTPGVLGMVERDWWPSPLVEQITAVLTGWTVRDLGAAVRRARRTPSASEIVLLRRSAAISAGALVAAAGPILSAAERAALVERSVRRAGAEDVYVTSAPLAGGTGCVEVFTEFRGYWTQAARVLALDAEPAWLGALRTGYAAAADLLRPGANVETLRAAVQSTLTAAAAPTPWQIGLVQHTDIETRGEYRLRGEAAAPLSEGDIVGLGMTWIFRDGTKAALADTYRIDGIGSQCLTSAAPGGIPG